MNPKPTYQPDQYQQQQQMYQASDGKWYPTSSMPQGWQQQQPGYGYGQQPYGQQQPMYPNSQPVYVQQQGGRGAGAAGAGMGVCAALCGALLCFDLGACLF
ncbi:hypothetical protein L486_06352 [Kwoniella mangroviensis CBS 10435]|uniref:Uncharacterized protein n=1 Tax=Kwoniella mangroviensis CBS 10435 TaxID=1331196 RepID=A0A1B9IL91_9TREE|nr:uncharacterized protein I203_07974 [Kwoniella mangroviensis CBS 8507]OCF56408.1 hypothetical protein L486_06352 [Kwoniella mangroviensis CBS 10435]OCF62993.1 hypothetical protein I203_07974 [Kwoniella mangroviensis CBS 8507]OCF79158.1 hypothetical protein I204_01105 [Kwoniella mangroviensis CBS 8886]